ncbi:hypothetical protein [Streptomyces sp. NPDC001635]
MHGTRGATCSAANVSVSCPLDDALRLRDTVLATRDTAMQAITTYARRL